MKLCAHGSVPTKHLGSKLRVQKDPAMQFTSKDSACLNRLRLDAQFRFQSRRYLPFDECCEWVRRNGWWKTQEDWEEWVAMGEDLSPYIPTRPDEYYSRLGKWRGWSFFLSGIASADDDPSWGPDGKGPIITR